MLCFLTFHLMSKKNCEIYCETQISRRFIQLAKKKIDLLRNVDDRKIINKDND